MQPQLPHRQTSEPKSTGTRRERPHAEKLEPLRQIDVAALDVRPKKERTTWPMRKPISSAAQITKKVYIEPAAERGEQRWPMPGWGRCGGARRVAR